jgi:uncharacterized protein (DUF1778 family)
MNNIKVKKVGRPPMAPTMTKGARLILRLSDSEKALYEAKAKKRGQKLSAWIRDILNRAE